MSDPSIIVVCAECGRKSDDQARGWRALVLSDEDERKLRDDGVAVFCGQCWEREFSVFGE